MPILQQLVARESARFAESKPCFDAAFLKDRRLASRRGDRRVALPCWCEIRTTFLTETIYQRPMSPLLWRFLNADYDEVAAGGFRNHVCGCEVALLPTIWFFRELSV